MALLEEFARDLAPMLLIAEAAGRITRPYEIEVIGADDELLGAYEVDTTGQWKLMTPDRRIDRAVQPITIEVKDSRGNRLKADWSHSSPF